MHWSAKPVCAGSIPALASTLEINDLDSLLVASGNVSDNKFKFVRFRSLILNDSRVS